MEEKNFLVCLTTQFSWPSGFELNDFANPTRFGLHVVPSSCLSSCQRLRLLALSSSRAAADLRASPVVLVCHSSSPSIASLVFVAPSCRPVGVGFLAAFSFDGCYFRGPGVSLSVAAWGGVPSLVSPGSFQSVVWEVVLYEFFAFPSCASPSPACISVTPGCAFPLASCIDCPL